MDREIGILGDIATLGTELGRVSRHMGILSEPVRCPRRYESQWSEIRCNWWAASPSLIVGLQCCIWLDRRADIQDRAVQSDELINARAVIFEQVTR